jgi:transposase
MMLHAGLDLSRRRLDVHLLDDDGDTAQVMQASPDLDGLRGLVRTVARNHRGQRVVAVVESMNGARFVHDNLELLGWDVEIADAQRVKGLAPLACKTDRIDAWVLAELSRRNLVPAIWLPDPAVRASREFAHWRLHLVRHRTALKNRVHSALVAFGKPCPFSDLFGVGGRALLERLELPDPWRGDIDAALRLIDSINDEVAAIDAQLKLEGKDNSDVMLLTTAPGVGWVLGYTIAAEIGDVARFASPTKLCGYTGLCPRVYQSGDRDYRGSLAKTGPKYLRWALIEAATNACRHPAYAQRYQRTIQRLGRGRGKKVARVEVARRLSEAIWHMLTRHEPFAPAMPPATPATTVA